MWGWGQLTVCFTGSLRVGEWRGRGRRVLMVTDIRFCYVESENNFTLGGVKVIFMLK